MTVLIADLFWFCFMALLGVSALYLLATGQIGEDV